MHFSSDDFRPSFFPNKGLSQELNELKAKKQKLSQSKVEAMFLKNIVAQLNFKNLIKPELEHKRNEIFKKLEELDYLLKIEVPVKATKVPVGALETSEPFNNEEFNNEEENVSYE